MPSLSSFRRQLRRSCPPPLPGRQVEGAGTESLQLNIVPDSDCTSRDPEEIVVCGSRSEDRYRLRPLPPGFEDPAVRAETGLFNGAAGGIHFDSVTFPNGMISKRIMVAVKTKF